ncbi:hypothetical protein DLREEDagrD3_09730 [Denitratisoma sp. agr-D3]
MSQPAMTGNPFLLASLDKIDQGLAVFDGDLRMVAWNQPFMTMLDFPQELAYVGSAFENLVRFNVLRGEYGPGDPEMQVAKRVSSVRKRPSFRGERLRPNGQILAIHGEALPDGGLAVIYTDVTESRRAAQLIEEHKQELEERVRARTAELEKANRQLTEAHNENLRISAALVQAQKMEAVGQLSGGIAHDFNNMLTVVIGNLATLLDRRSDDDALREYLEPAQLAAQRGVELVRRLLTFSRQQPLAPRPVCLAAMIRDMTPLLRRSLPETIRFETPPEDSSVLALADLHQLENALLNLALNARDAMTEGGVFRIGYEAGPLPVARRQETLLEDGDYVRLWVSDTGCGMDAATQARVFEPFFTTKPFGSGSGLGLSMVYGFVRQSGGAIHIASAPGQGTRIELILPRATAPAATDDDAPLTLPADGGARPLVLLVEDDPDVRRIVRLQLTDLGYPVLEAANGDEALPMIEHVPDIGLLVSDVVMPGRLDGRALAQAARRLRPAMGIVLMSGYADGAEDMAASDIPLLAKPFGRDALAAALATQGPVTAL